jgi:predicted site-specific integrase-resolvase
MNEQTGTVYTPEQIAEQWGVARHTVLRYLQTGKLKPDFDTSKYILADSPAFSGRIVIY